MLWYVPLTANSLHFTWWNFFLFFSDCTRNTNKWSSSGNTTKGFNICKCTRKEQVRLGHREQCDWVILCVLTCVFVCVCVCQHINVFPVLMFFWKREDIYLSFLCTADLWQRQLPAPPYGDPFISDCLWSEWHQCGELSSGYSQWLHKEQVNGANISMWSMKPQWDFYTCLTDNLLYSVLQSKYSLIKWAELSNVQVHSNFSILWHIAQNFKSYFITLHH